jgi:hypothetical protein
MAIAWTNWGHVHLQPSEETWSVGKAGRHRSLCWAYGEQDGKTAVRACNAYSPINFRPSLYARGLLDEENHRLFVYIH